ncbi:pyridoxine 5'-phosphate synthase [candidate division KSB1 bacterium]|nr:pyridoxine 5'-phosphate synthase [candidate division KSB1 bacterium]NIR69257.1 pyridoxine 5'-phosphate synthase [candidate division KSB1 bacterium]NIS27430.1 pyridoxine 5'-phosphate synthase [candidate division KSB1 bacterium]NIT74256.1 pyridoxine 5'-phosphate synthase [candidate division KSB1 bacterium]NIU28148.1 pyridoxine 5'-phosphate synthase [candidate division KSB1 bacterium]
MTKLSVNLNKFALLRNARGINFPNVIHMGEKCILAGTHGITVHPRPDQRHIKRSDVYELSSFLTDFPEIEFNIEGYPMPDFLAMVAQVKPHQCTLVPDKPEQLTSDHGWDLSKEGEQLQPIISDLKQAGIRVSLFMDRELKQIELTKAIGADRIELYTGPYARAFISRKTKTILANYKRAANKAQEIGLGVNAGHDLNLQNIALFCSIPDILEVSIGHAIVVESFDFGLEQTIKKYLRILNSRN